MVPLYDAIARSLFCIGFSLYIRNKKKPLSRNSSLERRLLVGYSECGSAFQNLLTVLHCNKMQCSSNKRREIKKSIYNALYSTSNPVLTTVKNNYTHIVLYYAQSSTRVNVKPN